MVSYLKCIDPCGCPEQGPTQHVLPLSPHGTEWYPFRGDLTKDLSLEWRHDHVNL